MLTIIPYIQGSLFATYGMMTADLEFWDLSSAAMAGTATMARRVRIHHANSSAISDRILLEHNASTSRYVQSLHTPTLSSPSIWLMVN